MTNRLWDARRKALQTVLKQTRLDAGMTQQELAALLAKPQSYVSKYESGERRLDFIEVLDICDVLQVPVGRVIVAYHQSLDTQCYGMADFFSYPQHEDQASRDHTLHEPSENQTMGRRVTEKSASE